MIEQAILFVFFTVAAGCCWLLMLKRRARDVYRQPWIVFTKRQPKPSPFQEAAILLGSYIGAALFTLLSILSLIGLVTLLTK